MRACRDDAGAEGAAVQAQRRAGAEVQRCRGAEVQRRRGGEERRRRGGAERAQRRRRERRREGGEKAQRGRREGGEAQTCQLSAGGSLLLSRVAVTASMEPCCLRSLKAVIGPTPRMVPV